MNRKRHAVVGVGHRSHSWIPQIVKTYKAQAELVALCDPVLRNRHSSIRRPLLVSRLQGAWSFVLPALASDHGEVRRLAAIQKCSSPLSCYFHQNPHCLA